MTNANSPKRGHLLGIDALRFMAALMVVWFHFGYLMGAVPTSFPGEASRQLLAFPEVYDWSYFGWVGVQIFFVISGFVIAFSGEKANAFSFFTSRVVRLAPGVWICSLITFLIILAYGELDHIELIRRLRHSMLFIPWRSWLDDAFWTLNIEISFYACVFVIIFLKRFDQIRSVAIFIGLCSSAFCLIRAFVNLTPTVAHVVQPFLSNYARTFDLVLLHHGVYFSLGVFLWLQMVKKPSPDNFFWMILFGAIGCLEVAVVASKGGLSNATWEVFPPCAVWLAGLLALILAVQFNSVVHRAPPACLRALKTAGLMTFPLYLVHMVAGATIMGRLVMLGLSRWVALALVSALALGAAFVIAKYLEPALQRVVKRALYWLHDRWRATLSKQPEQV